MVTFLVKMVEVSLRFARWKIFISVKQKPIGLYWAV